MWEPLAVKDTGRSLSGTLTPSRAGCGKRRLCPKGSSGDPVHAVCRGVTPRCPFKPRGEEERGKGQIFHLTHWPDLRQVDTAGLILGGISQRAGILFQGKREISTRISQADHQHRAHGHSYALHE